MTSLCQLGFGHQREPALFGNPVVDPAGWRTEELVSQKKWLQEISESEVSELGIPIQEYNKPSLDLIKLQKSDFSLPNLSSRLADIRSKLLFGPGFVLLRGFPVEEFGKQGSAIAFWATGQYLGDGVLPQNKHGHVLGHVTDKGESRRNPWQCGPYSCEEIPYHVDFSDLVGLWCLNVSQAGGESSLVSSVTLSTMKYLKDTQTWRKLRTSQFTETGGMRFQKG